MTSQGPSRTVMCKRKPVGGLSVETLARGGMSFPSVEFSTDIDVYVKLNAGLPWQK